MAASRYHLLDLTYALIFTTNDNAPATICNARVTRAPLNDSRKCAVLQWKIKWDAHCACAYVSPRWIRPFGMFTRRSHRTARDSSRIFHCFLRNARLKNRCVNMMHACVHRDALISHSASESSLGLHHHWRNREVWYPSRQIYRTEIRIRYTCPRYHAWYYAWAGKIGNGAVMTHCAFIRNSNWMDRYRYWIFRITTTIHARWFMRTAPLLMRRQTSTRVRGIHNSGIARNWAFLDARCKVIHARYAAVRISAESRLHELLTIAELEIDFLMLAAGSRIRAERFFFFISMRYVLDVLCWWHWPDHPIPGKINLLAGKSIRYTISTSMNKYYGWTCRM